MTIRRFYCMALVASLGLVHGDVPARGAEKAQGTETTKVVVKAKMKPADKWKSFNTRTLDDLPGFTPQAPPLDRFGGLVDRKEKATGFFHTAKVGDRWWLVDPDGGLFVHVGVDSISMGKTDASRKGFAERYKSPEDWAAQTTAFLIKNGFNGAGAWSDVASLEGSALRAAPRRLVYTQTWSFMSGFGHAKKLTHVASGHAGYVNGCIPVFHPDFQSWSEEYAKAIAATKDDPYLLGHFSDNEMPQPSLEKYLALDPADAGMASSLKAAKDWFAARKGKSAGVKDITAEDRAAWIEFVLDRYYTVVNGTIRKNDPNHLCLGPRYHGSDKRREAAFRAAGRHCDVIAFNYYSEWGPDAEILQKWVEWSGKPCMITEFYAKGDDVGFANTSGAGWIVPTQRDRGLYYQHFTLALLESKCCVGWHWFKYMDNDPSAAASDPSNADSNKGMVNLKYEPYAPLVALMKPLNENVYALVKYFDAGGGKK